MQKFHVAIGVSDIAASVLDYSQRLQAEPSLVVDGEYALWRTESLNFSIRKTTDEVAQIRHIGWEVEQSDSFSESADVNGIVWEQFTAEQQADEIAALWPQTEYKPAAL